MRLTGHAAGMVQVGRGTKWREQPIQLMDRKPAQTDCNKPAAAAAAAAVAGNPAAAPTN
jgi:hypothetical protein